LLQGVGRVLQKDKVKGRLESTLAADHGAQEEEELEEEEDDEEEEQEEEETEGHPGSRPTASDRTGQNY